MYTKLANSGPSTYQPSPNSNALNFLIKTVSMFQPVFRYRENPTPKLPACCDLLEPASPGPFTCTPPAPLSPCPVRSSGPSSAASMEPRRCRARGFGSTGVEGFRVEGFPGLGVSVTGFGLLARFLVRTLLF